MNMLQNNLRVPSFGGGQNTIELSPTSMLPEVSNDQRTSSSTMSIPRMQSQQNNQFSNMNEQKLGNYCQTDNLVQYGYDGKISSSPGVFQPQQQFMPVWQMLVYPFSM